MDENNNFRDWPEFFSPAYMADKLGLSKSSAYRISVNCGLARRVGSRLIIEKKDFIEWFDSKRIQPAPVINRVKCTEHRCAPIQRKVS